MNLWDACVVGLMFVAIFKWGGPIQRHPAEDRSPRPSFGPYRLKMGSLIETFRTRFPSDGDISLRIGQNRGIRLRRDSSLVVFGPTRSGKTRGVVLPAIESWQGSVLVTSVKEDVLRETRDLQAKRSRVVCVGGNVGELWRYWDPLVACDDAATAISTAKLLISVAPGFSKANGDTKFWYHLAEPVIAGLCRLASAESGSRSLEGLLLKPSLDEIADALYEIGCDRLSSAVLGVQSEDPRHCSSVLLTALEVLRPLVDAAAHFAKQEVLHLEELLDDHRNGHPFTLYVVSPMSTQEQLAPYFSALVMRVAGVFLSAETGLGGRDPLLFVLDEAANIAPVPNLAKLASTGSAFGLRMISIFQDLAQMRTVYEGEMGTIVNNHRAKLFLSGISDIETLQLMRDLVVVDEHDHQAHLGAWRMAPRGTGWLVEGVHPPRRVRVHGQSRRNLARRSRRKTS